VCLVLLLLLQIIWQHELLEAYGNEEDCLGEQGELWVLFACVEACRLLVLIRPAVTTHHGATAMCDVPVHATSITGRCPPPPSPP
jgi:hypothetical protein